MLVLSRRPGQDICIGDRIIVRVSRVNGQRVRLGLIAAAEVPIVRAELEPIAVVADRHPDDTELEDDL